MRRSAAAALAGALALWPLAVAGAETVTLTDVAGREVTVQVPVESVLLGEGRFLPSLAILERDDPTRRIAAMMADLKLLDPATYAQYRARFPRLDSIPTVGRSGAGSFSLERAIDTQPDVAIVGLASGHGPSATDSDIVDRLRAAGIPVVVIDFRIDPLVNTPKSIELLGRLLGREPEAAEFLAFYREELDRVARRLAGVTARPTVFLESRVGLGEGCCEAIGEAMMGRFVTWAGGRNVFADLIPGTHSTVSLEHLIVSQPAVYIATAVGNHPLVPAEAGRVILGAGTPREAARESLRQAVQRKGIAELEAVEGGNAHAIWHHFYNSPMNVAAVQAIAQWLHPDLFGDLDPQATLEIYFRRFQPVPLDGTYWISLTGD